MVTLTVNKVWANDSAADRPGQITMVLSNGMTATLNAHNGWSASVTAPRYDANGNEIRYVWSEPIVIGYRQTNASVNGTVTTFTNTRIDQPVPDTTYTVTVRYRYPDGTEAAPPVTETHSTGDNYSITSPDIPGYIPSRTVVTGTVDGRDVEYTVIYIPIPVEPDTTPEPGATPTPDRPGGGGYTVIEDYETPLGLGEIYLNVGDCYE